MKRMLTAILVAVLAPAGMVTAQGGNRPGGYVTLIAEAMKKRK